MAFIENLGKSQALLPGYEANLAREPLGRPFQDLPYCETAEIV